MLELSGVHAAYGPSRVLHGVSLVARDGEVVSLLGRNGAGKSTTLKAIMGLVDVSAGEVRFEGRSLRGRATHAIARLGIGYVPEDRRVFADLTVVENLRVGEGNVRVGERNARVGEADGTAPAGRARWTRDRVFALFPKLRELAHHRAGNLSGGEQQMLTIARTLMTSPRLLLLDEPSEGLAPLVVRVLADNIAVLKREGLGILLSEQNVKFARRLADRAYIIEKGAIRFEGSMAEIDADPAIRAAYLSV